MLAPPRKREKQAPLPSRFGSYPRTRSSPALPNSSRKASPLSMCAQQDQRSGYRTASHEQSRPLSGCHSPLPGRDLAETRRNSEVGPPIQWEGGLTQVTVHNATHQRPSGYPRPRDVASRDLMGPVTLARSNDRNSNKCTNGTSLIMKMSVNTPAPAEPSREIISPKFHQSGMVTGVLTQEFNTNSVTASREQFRLLPGCQFPIAS